jgi:electron transfer flavoprotein alpha/beta subunit
LCETGPDTAENEIEVNSDGTDIERDDLVYSVNEWDNYAVEEAIQIRDRVGGSVTVVTVGDDEAEEVLRREMAMGADNGVLLLRRRLRRAPTAKGHCQRSQGGRRKRQVRSDPHRGPGR